MDTLTIVLIVAVVLLAIGLAFVLLRQGGTQRADEAARQGQMALADTVQRVEQSLREQERALAAVVNDRLSRSEETTGKIVTDLRERLVRIDAAQKQIGDLSTQVVGLQHILTNKQARGAFGEVQLNDLVQSALDGYKVCLFSYGQTGAGKTHTMTGSRSYEGRGIIPRAISKVC